MKRALVAILVLALGAALVGLLAGDAVTVGVGQRSVERGDTPARANFVEVKWPFLRDQWGDGRAFRCAPADCGVEVKVYLRPKIGFCNCDSGVEDDAELDRVGDLELFSDKFIALGKGHEIRVGWMDGRSRPYRVDVPYGQPADRASDGLQRKMRRHGRDRGRTARSIARRFAPCARIPQWRHDR